ncbi:MAG: FHA domain-containing protein [Planctomycetes bacterium]|nr:FHA domain-containing protein [Planctomycetota bacterium]
MAELVVVKGAHRGAFAKIIDGPVTIGRAKSTQLALHEDTKVSHVHARVTPLEGERFILEDLGSTNGTFVNDERIEQIPLRSGDLVRIGRSLLIFRLGGSSVHLEDVGLEGGGSSHDIRPATGRMPPRPDEPPLDETGEREALPSGEEDERTEPMEGLLLAAGAADLASGLEGLAAALLRGCAAERAIVFLRHPLTRGLGRAALRARAGQGEGLVDADALARAAGGELVVTPRVAAGPVPAPGAAPLGVVLVDAAGREPAEVGRLLTAAGAVASLLVTNDRARRLADAAIDVVALAQERVARQAIELGAQLGAVDRMHGPVARQRGLGWKVVIPSDPLFVLADPLLLGRGLDRVLEHVLTVARGDVRVGAAVAADGRVRVEVTRPRTEPADAVQRLADPEGVVADLRRAREAAADAGLAVGRVALLRAGARLSVATGPDERVVYALELELAR